MRQSLGVLAFGLALGACSASSSPSSIPMGDFGSFNGATLELTAGGGIAALSVRHSVRHDDQRYVFSQRHICADTCGAPLDSASGALSLAATDSLFNIVLAELPSLESDYGATVGGADMMTYTLTVAAGGNVKTVRADDGTMPESMRRIVQSVREIIAAAR